MMCRVYGVSRDGYYSWKRRGKCQRRYEDEWLSDEISHVYESSGKLYGSPKVHESLKRKGIYTGQKRIARIMRENGQKARVAKVYKRDPGRKAHFTSIPNRQLQSKVDDCNQVWVGDLTYLKVGRENRYLAVVMDKHSRRVVGWSYGRKKNTELTLSAFRQAVRNRDISEGLVFHSDRGAEYAAFTYQEKLVKYGVIQSMNRPGKMNDNAVMESFFHSLKAERIHDQVFRSDSDLRGAISGYVHFYNQSRLHSSLGYMSPVEFEVN